MCPELAGHAILHPLFIKAIPAYPDGVVALHLCALSDNSPHPRAINHIPTSICTVPCDRMLRIMGQFLGVAMRFRPESRLEIWDWMTGQRMTVLDMKDGDNFPYRNCSVEFLCVAHRGVLEVYQIRITTTGALPIHTVSLCMLRLNLEQHHLTVRISGSPPLSQYTNHRNLSDYSRFPFTSSTLSGDDYYLTIRWGVNGPSVFAPRDTLAIPWKTWSKNVYFHNDLRRDYGIDPRTDYARLPCNKAGFMAWSDEDGTFPSCPSHLSKTWSLSLDDSPYAPHMVCNDEHVVFWGVHYLFIPPWCIAGLIFLTSS
ncbi:hypothetical protein BS47DRAFT_1485836 [Hydnum rufescens UP504]|uniref:Uncharacterized protein n=1 Tax=Hydnum rufescens UP504 TaxID=1448309 RepID=A0A9P6AXD2_9AGAM|nr:hypothetical protein BS47DRAFT_1485836 [Hydnum rufescens UP504]